MSEKSLYVLAGYDEETEERLSSVQDLLYSRGFAGTQTKNIPQHITLGSFPVEEEAALTGLLPGIAAGTRKFDVTFNHVGIFGGGKVLFIAPDTCRELLDLKERFGSGAGWTPHTTMLIDDPDIILSALTAVMSAFSPFSGKVTSLHLYEFFPARHIMTVKLDG